MNAWLSWDFEHFERLFDGFELLDAIKGGGGKADVGWRGSIGLMNILCLHVPP
jgi:hypothetical protein